MTKRTYVTFKKNIIRKGLGDTIRVTKKMEYMTKEITSNEELKTYLKAGWAIVSQHTIELEK